MLCSVSPLQKMELFLAGVYTYIYLQSLSRNKVCSLWKDGHPENM